MQKDLVRMKKGFAGIMSDHLFFFIEHLKEKYEISLQKVITKENLLPERIKSETEIFELCLAADIDELIKDFSISIGGESILDDFIKNHLGNISCMGFSALVVKRIEESLTKWNLYLNDQISLCHRI